MALSDADQLRLDDLRARLRRAPSPDPADPVQLVIRVPASLRDAVHDAASAAGAPSTQAWLEQVLLDAVEAEVVPACRAAREVAAELLGDIATWVDGGGLRAALDDVDAAEDDELRSDGRAARR